MSESGDFTPNRNYQGNNFDRIRRAHDVHVGRGYAEARETGVDAKKLLPVKMKTKSRSPVVILCDVTGSMGKSPGIMIKKMGYLEHEVREYLGDDVEFAFFAVGDIYSDTYPVQGQAFVKPEGTNVAESVAKLIIEGGGGGTGQESYEHSALYLARNVEMPNAVRPICIFIGDEKPYDFVTREQAKQHAHVALDQVRIITNQIFEELKAKFSVYLIRQTYHVDGDSMSHADLEIRKAWVKLLGEDRVGDLPDPERIVDVIFGIMAQETNKVAYFRQELEERQLPDRGGKKKVETTYKALKTIHHGGEVEDKQDDDGDDEGCSVAHEPKRGKKSKDLL